MKFFLMNDRYIEGLLSVHLIIIILRKCINNKKKILKNVKRKNENIF
jgi:hypothetical protein